jgi:transposase-like protein
VLTEFFRSLLERGLRMPTSVTSDGAPGLVKAIGACFPASIRIRCWFHRLAWPTSARSCRRSPPAR